MYYEAKIASHIFLFYLLTKARKLFALTPSQEEREMNYKRRRQKDANNAATDIPQDLNPNYRNANAHRIKSFLKKVTNWIFQL